MEIWNIVGEALVADNGSSTAARLDRKIYASWLSLIVTIRRWAGAVHGDIHSNRRR